MADELSEAVQIIRVTFDGVEVAMKIGSGGLNMIKDLCSFLKGMLDYEKSMGKTSMRKLLMKGGDLQVLQFQESDLKKVRKMAKKYGILYSELPKIHKGSGLVEMVIHSEAVPRANLIIQKLGTGKLTSIEDYMKNSERGDLSELLKFFEKQKSRNAQTPSEEEADRAVDSLIEKVGMYAVEKEKVSIDDVKENFSISGEQAKEVLGKLTAIGAMEISDGKDNYKVAMDKEAFSNRIKGYRELAERISVVESYSNPSLTDITISKTLIAEENERAVKTRVPGTWGANVRYLWINKENILEVHKGKTMLTFLDKEKEYKLYDDQNRVVEKKKGEDLYKSHYDPVEANLRKQEEDKRKADERRRIHQKIKEASERKENTEKSVSSSESRRAR